MALGHWYARSLCGRFGDWWLGPESRMGESGAPPLARQGAQIRRSLSYCHGKNRWRQYRIAMSWNNWDQWRPPRSRIQWKTSVPCTVRACFAALLPRCGNSTATPSFRLCAQKSRTRRGEPGSRNIVVVGTQKVFR